MLTAKQEAFVQNILKGMSQADAYRAAYNSKRMGENAIYREASLLMKNPKVAQRFAELTAETDKRTIMTAQERLEWLTERIADDGIDIHAKLKALDIMNKMSGEYVTRIGGEVSVKLEDLL
jgi:phage terminase small subunit